MRKAPLHKPNNEIAARQAIGLNRVHINTQRFVEAEIAYRQIVSHE